MKYLSNYKWRESLNDSVMSVTRPSHMIIFTTVYAAFVLT